MPFGLPTLSSTESDPQNKHTLVNSTSINKVLQKHQNSVLPRASQNNTKYHFSLTTQYYTLSKSPQPNHSLSFSLSLSNPKKHLQLQWLCSIHFPVSSSSSSSSSQPLCLFLSFHTSNHC